MSLWFSGVAVAAAQEGGEPPEYRVTIREALAEYHAKNFPEARALFSEAHRLMPNARTLRGLGMTAFELRSYRESIEYLQLALASEVKPLEGALRAETERLLKRAERFIGRLQVLITPSEARVSVDGNPVEWREGVPLILEIGSHTIDFHADGYLPETRTIAIRGRDSETWTIALTPVAPPPPPTPREVAESAPPAPEADQVVTEEPERARPLRKSPWLWTSLGVVVVGAIVASAVIATRDPGVESPDTGPNTPPKGVFTALQEAR